MSFVSEAFAVFLRNISPPETQIEAAERSNNALREFLRNDSYFGRLVLDSFLNGSYARKTTVQPIKDSPFKGYSSDHYQGYFHTDHLIPFVFFRKEREPKDLKTFDDLSFGYIFDGTADPADHAELMVGIEAGSYEVRRNMDRLPDFADPERSGIMSEVVRGRLEQW